MFSPINRTFKNAATSLGLTALAFMLGVSPAMAGKDFFKKDCRAKTTEFCQIAGQRLSHDKLTFVVHGGERKLQRIAYEVAQRLDDEGVPVAFLLAPDHDEDLTSTVVEFYTQGGTKYNSMIFSENNMDSVKQNMYVHAMKAYLEDFPPDLALR